MLWRIDCHQKKKEKIENISLFYIIVYDNVWRCVTMKYRVFVVRIVFVYLFNSVGGH